MGTTTLRKVLLVLWIIAIMAIPLPARAERFSAAGTVDAFFSPHGGAEAAIVRELEDARKEVLVQAYSFTSSPIAKALRDAHRRGVRIEIILDSSQQSHKYSSADFLAHAGIVTFIDAAHAIAHNKVMIIDHATLITGSFNFTRAAEEKNAENLLIMKGNRPLTDRYVLNFREHKAHSTPYARR